MKYKFTLENLDCANCAQKIEEKISKTPGFYDVTVNFSTLKLSFKTDKQTNIYKEIKEIVGSVEPTVTVILNEKADKQQAQRNQFDIFRLITGIAIYIVGMYLNVAYIALPIAVAVLLYKTAKKAFTQITKSKTLDENALITISVIGACLVDKPSEGIMVIVLYEIGKILEARAVNKTRKSIIDLMDIEPEYANLKLEHDIKKVSPEEVKIGDTIIVKTGEKIPLDGEVIKGVAEIDNSALTGESALVKVEEKSKVLSGGINVQGLIEIKVEKTYENSTVSQILNLVENATDKKAKTETFVARGAKIYTPTVFILAILVAVFMPIIFKSVTYSQSVYSALVFLVISCPCSIAISVPLSYFSGIGKASKRGILVKGSDYLDSLKDIREIIFDKTGTITTGDFTVSEIKSYNDNYSDAEILNYFAMGEEFSNHPIAKSILKKAGNDINTKDVADFEEITGKGIQYNYKGKKVKIGNAQFTDAQNTETTGTILYLKIDNEVIASILLVDEIKEGAIQAIDKLNKMGITTKMFTGDKKEVAIEIAKKVGINNVKYEMLPQDKYSELEKELAKNIKVAYVGDGINDSPVLTRADIGIAMGGIGSSSAIEASDIVIMTDELQKITEGIEISKKTNKIIKQNLIFAIGVKIIVLVLSLFGIATMWQAVFADVGTTLITILNTIRILK